MLRAFTTVLIFWAAFSLAQEYGQDEALAQLLNLNSLDEIYNVFEIEEGGFEAHDGMESEDDKKTIEAIQSGSTCRLENSSCVPLQFERTTRKVRNFPECVQMPRCVGTCCGSENKQCVANKTEERFVVIREFAPTGELSRSGKSKVKATRKRVPVEVHISCKCVQAPAEPIAGKRSTGFRTHDGGSSSQED